MFQIPRYEHHYVTLCVFTLFCKYIFLICVFSYENCEHLLLKYPTKKILEIFICDQHKFILLSIRYLTNK